MKVLHILKSEPDKTVEKLIGILSGEECVTAEALYQDDMDWSRLLEDIFAHDKIICWW